MSVTVWDIFKYIFSWKWIIAIVTVCAFVAANFYVDLHQTYSSKVIIQYNDSCISEGKNLKGQPFDSNEIKSPAVIDRVLREMGYKDKKIDSVRQRIKISPITPRDKTSMKEAKEKLGEEYVFYPNTFVVSYIGGRSYESTRDTLNTLITSYFDYYSESYLYLATLTEMDYDINNKNFDYLEQAELIENNIKQTISSLSQYSRDSNGYRSPSIGLTFDDLLKDFQSLYDFSLPLVFSRIYDGQVSVDKDLLINKYTERMEQNYREMDNLTHKAALAEDRMNAYVDANVDVPNSYNENINEGSDNIEIIDDIDERRDDYIDEQTTYDSIITNYASDSTAANNKRLDAEHCSSIIDRFSVERNPDIDYEEYENAVQTGISDILSELRVLYDKSNILIDDYNSYIPAKHIKKLSGVGYYENLSSSLYTLIAVIIGFSISCIAAICFGVMKKYAVYAKDSKKSDNDDNKDDEADKEDSQTDITN